MSPQQQPTLAGVAPSGPAPQPPQPLSAPLATQGQRAETFPRREFQHGLDAHLRRIAEAHRDKSLGAVQRREAVAQALVSLISMDWIRHKLPAGLVEASQSQDPHDVAQEPSPIERERRILAALAQGKNNDVHKLLTTTGLAHPTLEEFKAKFPLLTEWDMTSFPVCSNAPILTAVDIVDFCESRLNVGSVGPDCVPFQEWLEYGKRVSGADLLAEVFNIIHTVPLRVGQETLQLLTQVKSVTLAKDTTFRPIGFPSGLERIREGAIFPLLKEAVQLHGDNCTLMKENGVTDIILACDAALRRGATVATADLTNAFNRQSVAEVAARLRALNTARFAVNQVDMLRQHRVVHSTGSFTAGHIPQGSNSGSLMMAYSRR